MQLDILEKKNDDVRAEDLIQAKRILADFAWDVFKSTSNAVILLAIDGGSFDVDVVNNLLLMSERSLSILVDKVHQLRSLFDEYKKKKEIEK